MREYAVIIEKTGNGFGAHVPDLPGCIAGGDTLEEAVELIKGAIEMHIEDMIETGQKINEPTTFSVQVRAA